MCAFFMQFNLFYAAKILITEMQDLLQIMKNFDN